MNQRFKFPAILVLTIVGVSPLPTAAQAPPRSHEISTIWSSENGALYEVDLLPSRAFDELAPLRSSGSIDRASAPWSRDILTCEPQRSISVDHEFPVRDTGPI